MPVIENKTWAHSAEQRAIAMFKSEQNPPNPIILIGGVHGDEPEGVALAEATLSWLKSNTQKKLAPWIVIPCLNPDGFTKNDRTNGHGVDLNRNYPSRDWSPVALKPRYNPGPHPASEPEIRAIVSLIQSVQPRMIIHCHSWEPCIVYAGDPARTDAEALGRSSGYEVKDDIGYPTPGSLSRYGWHDNKIPIICVEEREKISLEKVWPNFSAGIESVFSNLSMRQTEE
jgi:murein peptide amidase A